jgi:RNA polymerase sigma factor (sigma-70 family)
LSNKQLIPHLFREEYSKMVAVLCKTFGLTHMELAQDIVSETFLKATETWGLKGVPEKPNAWLYTVAKNLAKDHFKRENIFNEKISPELRSLNIEKQLEEIDLSNENIKDSMLRMMFAVCHPSITQESQIVLSLRVLCGFSIDEIANALLSNKSSINKRLTRTKKTLRTIDFNTSPLSTLHLNKRLNSVLSVLYLLFNEGYFSSKSSDKIRKDLCYEAMRLLYIVISQKETNLPEANALMALFCFQASRFDARLNQAGEQILYHEQDAEKWNEELIKKGEYYLFLSGNKKVTRYHLEAMIALWHTRKNDDNNHKWDSILQLYNRLLQVQYSPITALNRTYALAMVKGKEIALKEALKIKLDENPLYHSLLAELYNGINLEKQISHLKIAIQLNQNKNDSFVLEKKLKEASKVHSEKSFNN